MLQFGELFEGMRFRLCAKINVAYYILIWARIAFGFGTFISKAVMTIMIFLHASVQFGVSSRNRFFVHL